MSPASGRCLRGGIQLPAVGARVAQTLLVGILVTGVAAWPSGDASGAAGTPEGSLAYSLAGSGSPVVVLQAGLGDDRRVWGAVYDGIAETTAVIAFDRPGYGGSGVARGPRDPCTIASEQRALLQAAGLLPPYVLVGHSLGGLYQFVYAKLYPQEVAGLVLLDPTHPRAWEQLRTRGRAAAEVLRMWYWSFNGVMRREFHDQSVCLDRLGMDRPWHGPVRILMHARPALRDPVERAQGETMVSALEADWLRLSGASRIERVPGAGHYLQCDRPDWIVRAVRAAVNEARARKSP